MKNNKGFTLIEMIGIIVLLAVIMLVVAPTMISTLKNSNDKRFDNFKKNLKIATENYIVDNKLTFQSDITVTLQTLQKNNYINEIPNIPAEDPMAENNESTELPDTAYVKVSKVNDVYTYKLCKVSDVDCESLEN